MVDLYTSAYTGIWKRDLATEGLVPVRISLGRPKFIPETAAWPYVAELAPRGLLHINDRAAFEPLYLERLDRFGVDRIQRRFEAISNAHEGRGLVLLCFERDPDDCHRRLFARWWRDRTGTTVPETRS